MLIVSLSVLSRSFNSSLALAPHVGTSAMTPSARPSSSALSKIKRVSMGCKKVVASKSIFLLASALKRSWWILANCDVRVRCGSGPEYLS